MTKIKQNAVRFRAARTDASIGRIIRRIERDYKLPKGSVRLYFPNGRKTPDEKHIGDLLDKWDRHS